MSSAVVVFGFGALCWVSGFLIGKGDGLNEMAEEVEKIYVGSEN